MNASNLDGSENNVCNLMNFSIACCFALGASDAGDIGQFGTTDLRI